MATIMQMSTVKVLNQKIDQDITASEGNP